MGIRQRLRHAALRLLGAPPQSFCQPALDSGSAVDGGNGFGAQKLLRSRQPASAGGVVKATSVLSNVQLITRYCAIEQPYWRAFLAHYAQMGVRLIHVCVQSDDDADAVLNTFKPPFVECVVHRLDAGLTPNEALKTLDLRALSTGATFTLLVDADEYLQPLRPDISVQQLFALFPDVAQFYLPWLMRPVLHQDDAKQGGFWGHIGKPVVRSTRMAAIAFDHGFAVDKPSANHRVASAPAGVFGMVIVHHWSRSFRDCLLKTLHNRFKDEKSKDCDQALALIRAGELPIRLRLLAYLSLQSGYLPISAGIDALVDEALETRLLRALLQVDDEIQCRQSFDRYQMLLKHQLPHLPLYPAVSLLVLARTLPSLAELEAIH